MTSIVINDYLMNKRSIKVWLPYIVGGSGTDVFTLRLARNLKKIGYEVVATPFDHHWQYLPWRLKTIAPPQNTKIIITNSWNGFAFKRPGIRHITVVHLLVVDPANRPYRSIFQAVYHELFIRTFEKQSLRTADKVVAVSQYTAKKTSEAYRFHDCTVIHNGIDTNFFVPAEKRPHEKFRILFVGNLSKRKGADLLPKVMKELGDGYHLYFTSGLRSLDTYSNIPNMSTLGRLNQDEVLREYRNADIFLFPTRLEGLPLVCAEAMACALPVVATRCSSLPEIVEHEVSGILCPIDNVSAFVNAIQKLSREKQDNLLKMGQNARDRVVRYFSDHQMTMNYHRLITRLLQK